MFKIWCQSCSVFKQDPCKIVGHLRGVDQQEILQINDALEFRPVEIPGGIDLTSQSKEALRPILKGGTVFHLHTVLGPPLTGGIKALQCKTIGIDALVAAVAALALLVLGHLFLERRGIA